MLNQEKGQDAYIASNQDKKKGKGKDKDKDKARKDQVMARINGQPDHERDNKKHESSEALSKFSKKSKKS